MTNDLISREALMQFPIRIDHYDKENGNENFVLGIESVLEFAKYLPAVDAVEVVHAEWKFDHMTGETAHYADCSICGVHKFFKDVSEYSNFCPNCGAKMGKRRESEVSE